MLALLAENRIGPGTVNGKGKAAAAMQTPFQSRTPFLQKPLFTEADTQLKGIRTQTRPFLDKTPLPNRVATASFNAQTPFLHPNRDATPDSAQRPSSTRKHIRLPRNSHKFETPITTGNHWEVGDSSDENIRVEIPEPAKAVPAAEEDFDEIDPVPLTHHSLDLPYQPPFDLDMPDYAVLGKAVLEASRKGWFLNGLQDSIIEIHPEFIEDHNANLDLSSLPDGDPFFDFEIKPQPKPSGSAVTQHKLSAPLKGRPVPVPAPSLPSSRSAVTRPATSASTRVPSRTVSRAGTVSSSKVVSRPPVVSNSRTTGSTAVRAVRATSASKPVTIHRTTSAAVARPTVASNSRTTDSTAVRVTSTSKPVFGTRVAPARSKSSVTAPARTAPTRTPTAAPSALRKPTAATVSRLTTSSATVNSRKVQPSRAKPDGVGADIPLNIDAGTATVEDFMFEI
ncbi:hypothetical protein D9757_010179 [Collybiopsis confluens]|uniref:Uncharacterized protein n=1 Tax=Collybiopsis confluens TaxID=2823264 RepID=A0A8H5LYU3_9AGAR|nr:hypothetical protein D9757_010179 [Collybiopsis confluens]